ncbi:hypothetical protein OH76DRAFT_1408909 [Lentinus brumalis]|uniref:Uncharacterized protein n=1 Tax=Lentinus brumalis TaxID=2498619 RepID=A0A371CWK1_9APHY|nr:hypothetical protein OH76DRAFT_1408909 [Polyporus brumalis]
MMSLSTRAVGNLTSGHSGITSYFGPPSAFQCSLSVRPIFWRAHSSPSISLLLLSY